jgi:hypothetical protein
MRPRATSVESNMRNTSVVFSSTIIFKFKCTFTFDGTVRKLGHEIHYGFICGLLQLTFDWNVALNFFIIELYKRTNDVRILFSFNDKNSQLTGVTEETKLYNDKRGYIWKKSMKLTMKFFKLEKSLKLTANFNVKPPAPPLSPDPGSATELVNSSYTSETF